MPSSSSAKPDHGVASGTDFGAAAAVVPTRPRTRRGRPEAKRPGYLASFLHTQDEIDAICEEHGVPSGTDLDVTAAVVPSSPQTVRGGPKAKRPEDFASFLRTQGEIDALCKEHGVPKEFTAHPAGELRANARPPPGAICVYARALEAGMRVPLDGFFCDALAHFGIAPTQLTSNGWRFLAGFLGLCRSVGVPPSLAVFRRFFLLAIVTQRQKKGWYFCRSRTRKSSALRFTGMPQPNLISFRYWKHEFFFLSSPEPWPCRVLWGTPSKRSFRNPVLTDEEKRWAAKLLRAHGVAAIDLRKYICNTNLTASLITSPKGMDPSVYAMMKTMLAEKAAAQASVSAKKLKAEPDSRAAGSPPLRGMKRSLKEANENACPPPSILNTALSSGVCSPPPGFSRKPQHSPSRNNGDGTREQLEEAKREAEPEEEEEKAKADLAATGGELAKAKAGLAAAEAEVVKAKAELTAAKQAADADQEKVWPELTIGVVKAKAKLAAAKRALEEELQSAKTAAVRQLLCCEDHVRRRAEHALERYRRWRTGRAA
uniref:Uncharacterized protein n=1 Tax=Avena sativa TaxID=4498 RepID=A0ACD5Y139_AVESA